MMSLDSGGHPRQHHPHQAVEPPPAPQLQIHHLFGPSAAPASTARAVFFDFEEPLALRLLHLDADARSSFDAQPPKNYKDLRQQEVADHFPRLDKHKLKWPRNWHHLYYVFVSRMFNDLSSMGSWKDNQSAYHRNLSSTGS